MARQGSIAAPPSQKKARDRIENEELVFKQKIQQGYLEIARSLGFLPLALRQAISLMLFEPHYPARTLLKKLANEDRLQWDCDTARAERKE